MIVFNRLRLLSVLVFLLSFKNTHAQTVYITEQGKKYHTKKCPEVKTNKKAIDLKEAQKKGYKGCANCGSDTLKVKEKEKKTEVKRKEEEN